MAKRPVKPETTTNRSWAERYIDKVRQGRFERVNVKYPRISDRRAAGNIPYTDKTLHRTWGGEVPQVGRPNNAKEETKGAFRLDEQKFQWSNKNPNKKKLGRLEIGTSNGIESLVEDPFTPGFQQGFPTDNPVKVTDNYTPDHNEVEFIIGGSISQSENLKTKYQYKYPVDPNKTTLDNRIYWEISPDYQTPTAPQTRFPKKGAMRRKNSFTKYRG